MNKLRLREDKQMVQDHVDCDRTELTVIGFWLFQISFVVTFKQNVNLKVILRKEIFTRCLQEHHFTAECSSSTQGRLSSQYPRNPKSLGYFPYKLLP